DPVGLDMTISAAVPPRSAASADGVDVRSPSSRTILLATALSPASAAAESEAIGLARDLRASLLVLSVIDPRSLRGARGQWIQRADQARAALTVRSRDVIEQARMAGVPVRLLIWEGDPAESIVE